VTVSAGVLLEREKRRTAREARLWEVVNDPMLKRLVLLALIVAYSTYVTRSKEKQGPVASALAMTLPTVGIPMLAAECGITDWRALLAIGGAAGVFTAASAEIGLNEVGRSLLDSVTLDLPGTDYPILSLAGPIPALQYWKEKFT
jgi:hypothetical protein